MAVAVPSTDAGATNLWQFAVDLKRCRLVLTKARLVGLLGILPSRDGLKPDERSEQNSKGKFSKANAARQKRARTFVRALRQTAAHMYHFPVAVGAKKMIG